MGFVDIRMLVDEGIPGVVPDKLNRDIQLIFASDAVTQRGHLRAARDGVGPAKAGDGGFDRIDQHRQALNSQGIGRFARAAVTAVNADVTGQNRQHGNRPGSQLPVSLALRSPALANTGGSGGANFAGQLNDSVDGDPGDPRRPLRRFGGSVLAVAENVGFIVTVWRGAGGKGFFVVADAVFIQERLIDQILVNQYPGDTGYQCGVGAWTDRDPFIFPPGGSIGIAGVNDNHARVGAFAGLLEIPGNAAAAHAGFRRVIAEHHHQSAVFDI